MQDWKNVPDAMWKISDGLKSYGSYRMGWNEMRVQFFTSVNYDQRFSKLRWIKLEARSSPIFTAKSRFETN